MRNLKRAMLLSLAVSSCASFAGASEITHFRSEACGSARALDARANQVRVICVGKAQDEALDRDMRAVGIQTQSGETFYYVENGIPGVELMQPQFEAIGPIQNHTKSIYAQLKWAPLQKMSSEVATVSLEVGANGQLSGVRVRSSQLGEISAKLSRFMRP